MRSGQAFSRNLTKSVKKLEERAQLPFVSANFSAERFFRSRWSQKMKCRALNGLSISIK